ncbi:polymeric immunoglobulin receptor-like [Hoplias malabaricus]|uniref:polymeric immunoglobulin receptor-like n=1 Tax=Hoplias malabaricus TaxID=27720 RepID=UPI003462C0FD
MKIFLIFTFFLISGPVGCFDVIGYTGGTVSIYFYHQQYGQNGTYFFYRNLSLQDSGSYQCGETGGWSHDVELKVKRDPCCSGPSAVTGFLGESLTINCSYPEEFKTDTKYLYKQDGDYITKVITTTESQRNRFSISEDRSFKVISVRISDVREDDGGVYYCGMWNESDSVHYYSLFSEIQLQVNGLF